MGSNMSKLRIVSSTIVLLSLCAPYKANANLCNKYLTTEIQSLVQKVSWDSLIPGQTHFGKYIVEKYDFKRPVKTITTPSSIVLDKKIPVVEVQTPSSTHYFMVDNHHTLFRFVNMFPKEKKRDLLVPIEVIDSFQASKIDHLTMQRLVAFGFAWSGEPLTPQWRFEKHWPQNILELRDLPMRSFVQLLFFELDLSGKSFKPYMQFYLAESFLQKGFALKSKDFNDPRREVKLKKKLRKFLIQFPEVLQELKENISENDTKRALEKIESYENQNL